MSAMAARRRWRIIGRAADRALAYEEKRGAGQAVPLRISSANGRCQGLQAELGKGYEGEVFHFIAAGLPSHRPRYYTTFGPQPERQSWKMMHNIPDWVGTNAAARVPHGLRPGPRRKKCQCLAKTKPPGVSLLVRWSRLQELGGGPFCPGGRLRIRHGSRPRRQKKVYCCSFLSFRFVEANNYWYQGWHGRGPDSCQRGRCLLIGPETFLFRKGTSGVTSRILTPTHSASLHLLIWPVWLQRGPFARE